MEWTICEYCNVLVCFPQQCQGDRTKWIKTFKGQGRPGQHQRAAQPNSTVEGGAGSGEKRSR